MSTSQDTYTLKPVAVHTPQLSFHRFEMPIMVSRRFLLFWSSSTLMDAARSTLNSLRCERVVLQCDQAPIARRCKPAEASRTHAAAAAWLRELDLGVMSSGPHAHLLR